MENPPSEWWQKAQIGAETAPYLRLKSNGLSPLENLPVTFGFSPRTVPANIAKSYRHNSVPNCFSSRFSTSPHKRAYVRFLTSESGYTLGFQRRIAHEGRHTAKQGCFGRGGGITTLSALLRAAETPDGRLSKRLIFHFLRSGGRSSPHDSYFLANTQNFLLAVPVANAFAL